MTDPAPISAGDIGAEIHGTLYDNGVAVDLTGATVVLLVRWRNKSKALTATVVSAEAGTVKVVTTDPDFNVGDGWEYQWRATWSGSPSTVIHYPSKPAPLTVYAPISP